MFASGFYCTRSPLWGFLDASICLVTNFIGGGGALTVIVALQAGVGGSIAYRRGSQ